MDVITSPAEMAALRTQWAREKEDVQIALVPTMGALHEGHGALCRLAREKADRVVVSIFVNPLQFGAHEDLERYPRPREADLAQCQAWRIDAVYYPDVEAIYPHGMANSTHVLPPDRLTNRLCGAARPGHFTGVATVVLILINQIRPDWAVFGEKDAQQVMVLRRMVADLSMPVALLIHPVVREASGLALSSRNQYLKTDRQREAALLLSRILNQAKERVLQSNACDLPAVETLAQIAGERVDSWRQVVPADSVGWRLQYLEAVDEQSLEPAPLLRRGCRLFIAAFVDDVRLIDTLLID